MRFRSLTTRFVVVVGAALVVVAAAFTLVVLRQATSTRQSRRLGDVLRNTIELNQRLRADINTQTALVYRFLDTRDRRLINEYDDLHFALGRRQIEYLRMDIGDRERLQVVRIRDLQEELARRGAMAMDSVAAGDMDGAIRNLGRMGQVQSEVNGAFERLSVEQVAQLGTALTFADDAVRDIYAVTFGVIAVFATLLATVALLLRRRVQQPLANLLEAARQVRQGDLAARALGETTDEVGRVVREFNFMAGSLEASYAGLESKVEERTSEIRALQEKLVRTERMSAMGQLVSGVAHELNNPLTTILGFAEIEREARGRDATDRERGPDAADPTALDEIVHQAERCRRIVADLLQFARQRETDLENVDLDEMVERTLRLRAYEVDTQGIRLVRDHGDRRLVVRGDPYKIEQVILILVNNAVDAIREAGGSGVIVVATRRSGNKAVLEVRDTGKGFDEPQRVFEPFYTTKEVGKGTGLGLSVAYGIVSDHGGDIHGENWAEGARVVVELPLSEDQASVDPSPATAPLEDESRQLSGTILTVDDEPSLLRLQKRIGERMGVEVRTAESGDVAVAMMREDRFDAVICDLRMPGRLDGRGVYAWVCENLPELAARFVFASGDMSQSGASGDDLPARCIHKPFNPAEYRRLLAELLGERIS